MSLVVNISWNFVFLESYDITSREGILLLCSTSCLKQESLLKHHSKTKECTMCEKLCPCIEKPTWCHGIRCVTTWLMVTPQPLLTFWGAVLFLGSVQRLAAWVEGVGWCHGNLFSQITMEVNPCGVPSADTGKPKTPGRGNFRNREFKKYFYCDPQLEPHLMSQPSTYTHTHGHTHKLEQKFNKTIFYDTAHSEYNSTFWSILFHWKKPSLLVKTLNWFYNLLMNFGLRFEKHWSYPMLPSYKWRNWVWEKGNG